jgi:hypothetical protein
MPHLLYTAKGPTGNDVRGFVAAGDGMEEALRKLSETGLTDIVFHQDSSASDDAVAMQRLSQAELDALARFKQRLLQQPSLQTVYTHMLRTWWWLGLLALGAMFAAMWMAQPVLLAAVLVALVAPFAWVAWRHRYARYYEAFLWAYSVGQIGKAQQMADKLRAVSPQTEGMDFDLDMRLAYWMARNGKLPQALDFVQPWRERMADSLPLLECRMASLYAAAGDREGFVAAMGRAYALSDNDPCRAVDWALAMARFGDAEHAQRVLDTVDVALLPALSMGFVTWTRGLCQLRQGHADALTTLGQAVKEMLALAHQPAVWTALAFCTCDLALALAKQGEAQRAKHLLGRVWPIVKVHADRPLFMQFVEHGFVKA